uniref:Putative membrane protein (DUF2078) n=1 Tax=Desulfovibrio sp. U5L TaxID=596152 RepID=I2PXK0_9BACT
MWGCQTFLPFHGGGSFFPGAFLWLLVLVAVFLIVRAMLPAGNHRRGARADREDAMRILRTRLAEGAISEEEFDRLRRAVES